MVDLRRGDADVGPNIRFCVASHQSKQAPVEVRKGKKLILMLDTPGPKKKVWAGQKA